MQLNAQFVFAQKLDSISMLIGDQQYLTLATNEKDIGENPFTILDTMSWFHIVDKGNWTLVNRSYERKILFTVFDSGYYTIRPLGILPDKDSILQLGNPLSIEVTNPSDSLNILRPIKSIEETKTEFRYFTLIVLGILLIAGMLFVLWLFFKADRIKPSVIYLPLERKIWEQSLQSLYELDEKKLWQNGKVKEFYDGLNLILRNYLSAGLKVPALENTSGEIIDFIKTSRQEIKDWEVLRDCFKESDFAKFANMVPLSEKNLHWFDFAKQFVKENADFSESILEETRMHWLALLGESMASQFESQIETVPSELLQLYDSTNLGKIELLHQLINRSAFQLPESWIKWHEMHIGVFFRWQFNILSISNHKVIQLLLMIFVLPFITLFLPFVWLVSIWKKQDLFSRGVFGLSSNNKLVLRKIK